MAPQLWWISIEDIIQSSCHSVQKSLLNIGRWRDLCYLHIRKWKVCCWRVFEKGAAIHEVEVVCCGFCGFVKERRRWIVIVKSRTLTDRCQNYSARKNSSGMWNKYTEKFTSRKAGRFDTGLRWSWWLWRLGLVTFQLDEDKIRYKINLSLHFSLVRYHSINDNIIMPRISPEFDNYCSSTRWNKRPNQLQNSTSLPIASPNLLSSTSNALSGDTGISPLTPSAHAYLDSTAGWVSHGDPVLFVFRSSRSRSHNADTLCAVLRQDCNKVHVLNMTECRSPQQSSSSSRSMRASARVISVRSWAESEDRVEIRVSWISQASVRIAVVLTW